MYLSLKYASRDAEVNIPPYSGKLWPSKMLIVS